MLNRMALSTFLISTKWVVVYLITFLKHLSRVCIISCQNESTVHIMQIAIALNFEMKNQSFLAYSLEKCQTHYFFLNQKPTDLVTSFSFCLYEHGVV